MSPWFIHLFSRYLLSVLCWKFSGGQVIILHQLQGGTRNARKSVCCPPKPQCLGWESRIAFIKFFKMWKFWGLNQSCRVYSSFHQYIYWWKLSINKQRGGFTRKLGICTPWLGCLGHAGMEAGVKLYWVLNSVVNKSLSSELARTESNSPLESPFYVRELSTVPVLSSQ